MKARIEIGVELRMDSGAAFKKDCLITAVGFTGLKQQSGCVVLG